MTEQDIRDAIWVATAAKDIRVTPTDAGAWAIELVTALTHECLTRKLAQAGLTVVGKPSAWQGGRRTVTVTKAPQPDAAFAVGDSVQARQRRCPICNGLNTVERGVEPVDRFNCRVHHYDCYDCKDSWEWHEPVTSVEAPDAWVPEPVEGGQVADDEDMTYASAATRDNITSAEWDALMPAEQLDAYRVLEGLLNSAQRVVNAVPECKWHGYCVPHAVQWVEDAKALGTEHAAVVAERDALRAQVGAAKAEIARRINAASEMILLAVDDEIESFWRGKRDGYEIALATLEGKV